MFGVDHVAIVAGQGLVHEHATARRPVRRVVFEITASPARAEGQLLTALEMLAQHGA